MACDLDSELKDLMRYLFKRESWINWRMPCSFFLCLSSFKSSHLKEDVMDVCFGGKKWWFPKILRSINQRDVMCVCYNSDWLEFVCNKKHSFLREMSKSGWAENGIWTSTSRTWLFWIAYLSSPACFWGGFGTYLDGTICLILFPISIVLFLFWAFHRVKTRLCFRKKMNDPFIGFH